MLRSPGRLRMWHPPMRPYRASALHFSHGRRGPCGCAMGETRRVLICDCGAGYDAADVAMFPVWRCYDCARLFNMFT